MKLKEMMSPASVYFEPSDSLLKVAESMAEKHHSCALICEFDRPTGIITERDIVRLFASQAAGSKLAEVPIRDVMTHQPICIDGETRLLDALELARSRNLRHLPIIDSTQKYIGVVTMADMVKAYMASLETSKDSQGENQKLHILSIEDPLTGLPNRRAMEIDIRHAAAIAQRRSAPYSVALIDLDYFKNYNDCYGHQAGDDALVAVADIFRRNLRSSDMMYRYGGEEFLFLMPFTPAEGATIACERMRETIRNARIEHSDSPFDRLTVSVGIASGYSEHWEIVIEQADAALYDAKQAGRNRVSTAETPPDTGFWDLSRRTGPSDRLTPN